MWGRGDSRYGAILRLAALSHTQPHFPVVVGTLHHSHIINKVNKQRLLFLRWWRAWRLLCWFLQQTTEQFSCFAWQGNNNGGQRGELCVFLDVKSCVICTHFSARWSKRKREETIEQPVEQVIFHRHNYFGERKALRREIRKLEMEEISLKSVFNIVLGSLCHYLKETDLIKII